MSPFVKLMLLLLCAQPHGLD